MKALQFAIIGLIVPILACEKVVDFQPQAFQPEPVVYGAVVADSPLHIWINQTQTQYGWLEQFPEDTSARTANVRLSLRHKEIELTYQDDSVSLFCLGVGFPCSWSSFFTPLKVAQTFTSNRSIEGGNWVDFEARLGNKAASHRIYVPQKGNITHIGSPKLLDTSYTQTIRLDSRELGQQVLWKRWEYLLPVDFEIDPEAQTSHWALVRFSRWYYVWAYAPTDGTFQKTDSLYGRHVVRTKLEPGKQAFVRLLSQSQISRVQDSTISFSSSNWGIADLQSISVGDTMNLMVELFLISGHQAGAYRSLAQDIHVQELLREDTLLGRFAEPFPVESQLDQGLGVLTGYAISEPIKHTIKVWRPEGLK